MEDVIVVAIVFTFITIIVIAGIFAGIYKEKMRSQQTNDRDDKYLDYDLRLDKLEQRIANLETLVLEKERDKKFSSL